MNICIEDRRLYGRIVSMMEYRKIWLFGKDHIKKKTAREKVAEGIRRWSEMLKCFLLRGGQELEKLVHVETYFLLMNCAFQVWQYYKAKTENAESNWNIYGRTRKNPVVPMCMSRLYWSFIQQSKTHL